MSADLRDSVIRSIEALGTGFISHPANDELRLKLESSTLSAQDFYRQLIHITYRLWFLLVAEHRDLLHAPNADARARALYEANFSMRHLCDLSVQTQGSQAADAWHIISRVSSCLANPNGCDDLALPGLGSFLWASSSTPDLLGPAQPGEDQPVLIYNDDFFIAIRSLFFIESTSMCQAVDCHAVESRQFGTVYEALLELDADINVRTSVFRLRAATGNKRKATGSYYTPEALVQSILDFALEPVIEERLKEAEIRAGSERRCKAEAQSEAILGMKVCDPAVGSGHFLIAAAYRLAKHLTRLRSHNRKPLHDEQKRSLRDVIRRCLYGVDINPMAAELCKVALWIEARDPGAPLTCLNDHIKVGDALLGATPELLAAGIPNEAFVCSTGDDKQVVRYYKKRNTNEREAKERCDDRAAIGVDLSITEPAEQCSGPEQPTRGEHARMLADAWCAAFVWHKHDTDTPDAIVGVPGPWDAITEAVYRTIEQDPSAIAPWVREEIRRLAQHYQFFHWHLQFPEVFGPPGRAAAELQPPGGKITRGMHPIRSAPLRFGFDVIIGNPPFLNQLESATVAAKGSAALIQQRLNGCARGYTDLSAAFLMLSTLLVCEGGRVTLVQPQSLLAAKDARRVREAVTSLGSLVALWVANEHVFENANIYTCAPTIHVDGPRRGQLFRTAKGSFDALEPIEIDNDELAGLETWAHLVASASGIPELVVKTGRTIAKRAIATADFRNQFYGLDGFLVEDADVDPSCACRDQDYPRVITTGLLDLAECRWGRTPTRILKRKWERPRVDRRRMIAEGELGPWIDRRLVPKVLIATQTKVIEAVADEPGELLPSVPLISVIPKDAADLWRLAAALASPVCTAIAAQKYAGAALNVNAIKLSAKQVLALPLPSEEQAWNKAAHMFRAAQLSTAPAERHRYLVEMGRSSCDAYRVAPDQRDGLMAWWRDRLGSAPCSRSRVGHHEPPADRSYTKA